MWREPTEDDLTASMTIQEIEVFRKSGGWQSDPVKLIIERTIALIRGYIRTNGKVVMSSDKSLLPESCIGHAMNYVAAELMLRWGGKISDGRKEAKKDAASFFNSISRRWINPENYGAEENEVVSGPAIEVVQSADAVLDHDELEGL